MQKSVMLTEEGLRKLEEELEFLKGENEKRLPKKLRLPVHSVTFQKTANTTTLKTNRLFSKQELQQSRLT